MVSFRGEPAPANDEEVASLMILDGTDKPFRTGPT
jgi:hypothetical protein